MRTTRSTRFFVILFHLIGIPFPSRRRQRQLHQHSDQKQESTPPRRRRTQTQQHRVVDAGQQHQEEWPPFVILEGLDLYAISSSSSSSSSNHRSRRRRSQIAGDDAEVEELDNSDTERRRRKRRKEKQKRKKRRDSSHISDDDPATSSSILWLQDKVDGMCLGPAGAFVECGDAVLWVAQRRKLPLTRRQWFHLGVWGIDEDVDHGSSMAWSFNVVDHHDYYDPLQPQAPMNQTEQQQRTRTKLRRWQRRDAAAARATPSMSSDAASDCLTSIELERRNTMQQQQRLSGHDTSNETIGSSFSSIEVERCDLDSSPRQQRRRGRRRIGSDQDHKNDEVVLSSWAWHVHENGAIQRISLHNREYRGNDDAPPPLCLWRVVSGAGNNNTTGSQSSNGKAILSPCSNATLTGGAALHDNTAMEEAAASTTAVSTRVEATHRMVQFAFVRYHAVAASLTRKRAPSPSKQRKKSKKNGNKRPSKRFWRFGGKMSPEQGAASASDLDGTASAASTFASIRDVAHQRAIDPVMFPDLKTSATLLFSDPSATADQSQSTPQTTDSATGHNQRLVSSVHSVLKGGNPILWFDSNTVARTKSETGVSDSGRRTKPTTIRRIQKHPYIEASTNEIWVDPQTGLQFPTDLRGYLGRTDGRHTLMGVGQYKKAMVVKIYGVSLYVSKRDILADQSFERYATMSAEELRQQPDFYERLRAMPPHDGAKGTPPPAGLFERTLLLKTNMQLSAEAIRSSLTTDWQMLTDEAKEVIIGSSFVDLDADEAMLRIIADPNNPSGCSCSQRAPPEYNADPSCCARGTELAFTWLKNGHLEIRCNGRLMVTFDRRDIPEGIFFEYLRTDIPPMSPEFLERVTDGFPFLLAPLAQVRGVHMGGKQQDGNGRNWQSNPIVRGMSGLASGVSSQLGHVNAMVQNGASALQHGAAGVAENAAKAARACGDASHNFGQELDRRRGLLVKHVVSLPGTVSKIPETVMRIPEAAMRFPEAAMKVPDAMMRFRDKPIQTITEWVAGNRTPMEEEDQDVETLAGPTLSNISIINAPRGRAFGYPASRWFGEPYPAPDEIGPMVIHPTMNMTRKVCLALTHLYLLLLFIVSFPGSYTTRAKLVSSRKGHRYLRRYSSASTFSESVRSSAAPSIAYGEDSPPNLVADNMTRPQNGTVHEQASAHGKLLSHARKVLRPMQSADDGEPVVANSANRLKKKSLSYFL